ncbi:CHAP domain-containing protein [Aquimarina sp. U1-2]|uniref:CHAP domain-containing protein n=1 Tax=Aquimarina sp. U1-2 TaxID=2823141 RepID=UPI001AECBE7E|nr:CHAP domain-containing protein [Aquimarina sp. U1-2]MBP2831262.1 CHAP domain-containing protein [Aquimarina sp. U1-2]
MAKIKTLYVYLLCFFVCSSTFSQNDLGQPATQSKRFCLKQIYDSQLGVREQGGANQGKQVEQYLASVGFGPGFPWCAAFVSWCYQQANVEAPKSAWVPSYAQKQRIIYKRGRFIKELPQPGDVFLIWYQRLNRPAHIGFVDEWKQDWVITVEGNTNDNGSREGDGVYRKKRLKRQVWAVVDFIGE